VIDADIPAEMLLQAADNLRGKRDFREQVQRLLTLPDDGFDLADIDLGLTA